MKVSKDGPFWLTELQALRYRMLMTSLSTEGQALVHENNGWPHTKTIFEKLFALLIPDEIRKCVAFLMYRDATKFRFGGSCFFVATPLSTDKDKPNFMYIVTAAHVIRAMRERSVDGNAYVR